MTEPHDNNSISRRDFLARSAKAGAAIAATGVVGYWLYDRPDRRPGARPSS